MAFETDFAEMMPRTITVHPFSSEDSGGRPTYGASASYDCYIKDDVKWWRWEDGQEKGPRRLVYVNTGAYRITPKDKLVFTAGTTAGPETAHPTWVQHLDDEDGYHHTVVYI